MSKKTLNKANLADLGVDRLGELLIEVSQVSADIKRRLRLELSYNLSGVPVRSHWVMNHLRVEWNTLPWRSG